MEKWGADLYGQPCRECGYDRSISGQSATDALADLPAMMTAVLAGARGDEQHQHLSWSPSAYVSHVTDNLHIGSERLIGAMDAGVTQVHSYDQEALAAARGYTQIPLAAALWSLRRAVAGWLEVVDKALQLNVTLDHESRGLMSTADVARSQAHDAFHHLRDLRMILGTSPA